MICTPSRSSLLTGVFVCVYLCMLLTGVLVCVYLYMFVDRYVSLCMFVHQMYLCLHVYAQWKLNINKSLIVSFRVIITVNELM